MKTDWLAALVLSASAVTPALGQPAEQPDPAAAARAEAEALARVVDPAAEPERLAASTEFKFLEGPVWVPARGDQPGFLLFSDIPADTIYKWTPAAGEKPALIERFMQPSGHSNGLMIDGSGNLIICEHERRLSRLDGLDPKTLKPLAEAFEGKKLNSPNDLDIHSSGTIYFTDPPYGLGRSLGKEGKKELDYHGVFRFAPSDSGGTLTLATRDLRTPNGLAFSPDEKLLYIADMGKSEIRVFDVKPDGTIDNNRLFAEVKLNGRSMGGDGVRVDTEGNVYVAARGGVWVFDPSGAKLGVIIFPHNPANLCFGGDDMKTMYVTAQGGLYRIPVKIPGKR